MIPAEIIRRKRDGAELSDGQIGDFVRGFCSAKIPDYQITALAMAVYFQGMTDAETTSLTRHMLQSGEKLSWTPADDSRGPVIDKHSTGGIGDKVSIVLAPLLAACGARVPMISGRGLGPTGGTLDKLESIPGFRTDLALLEIQSQVESIGCVITGATDEIAPADRRLYALRDVTATVESIPLITASIMSKKLAESLDSLVLDVKFGSGSFMKTLNEANQLARSLVRVGKMLGVKTTALLTDMNQPLGRMVGNAVEVKEAIDCLKGGGPTDLRELVLTLASQVLNGGDRTSCQLGEQLDNGAAYAKFEQMVQAQGGDLSTLAQPGESVVLEATQAGTVQSINGQAIGNALIEMGGGRRVASERIDHAVGLEMQVRLGDRVEIGQPLVRAFSNPVTASADILNRIHGAIKIGEAGTDAPQLIAERVME